MSVFIIAKGDVNAGNVTSKRFWKIFLYDVQPLTKSVSPVNQITAYNSF